MIFCAENGRALVGGRDNGDGAKSFAFRDLAIATQNFREENKIGQGGFGSVFKGRLGANQVIIGLSFCGFVD